jgi:hypothetical protein
MGKQGDDVSGRGPTRVNKQWGKKKRRNRGGTASVPGSADDSRRCTATANRTGERCRAPAIKGGTVCRVHGGAAGHVKKAAKERLLELVDPALAALHKVLTDKDADDSTKVRAAVAILDRTGHGPGAHIEIGVSKFDQIAANALGFDLNTGTKLLRELPTPPGELEAPEDPTPPGEWDDLEPHDGPVVQGEVILPGIPPTGPSEHDGSTVWPYPNRPR